MAGPTLTIDTESPAGSWAKALTYPSSIKVSDYPASSTLHPAGTTDGTAFHIPSAVPAFLFATSFHENGNA
jgi:hypothetical protein